MTFHRPIKKEELKIANREIARMARKGEIVEVDWTYNSA